MSLKDKKSIYENIVDESGEVNIALDMSTDEASLPEETAAKAVSEKAEEVSEDAVPEEKSEFDKSVDSFKAEDAEPSLPKKKRAGRIVKHITLAFFGVMFLSSVYYLATNLYSKYQSDKLYEELGEQFGDGFHDFGESLEGRDGYVKLLASDIIPAYTPTMSQIIADGGHSSVTSKPYTAELEKMRAKLESLANINPDIYGWISVPGTEIFYPVTQTTDNDYYLNHNYEGAYSVNGSIYADFRVSDDPRENKNTVLYGHNITSGSMFHGVENFFDREVFDNTKIYLYTMKGIFIYQAFSIHEANYDSGYIDTYFPEDETFVQFLENLNSLSDLKAEDLELDGDTSIITLSTCTNGLQNRRYALHGVLINAITE